MKKTRKLLHFSPFCGKEILPSVTPQFQRFLKPGSQTSTIFLDQSHGTARKKMSFAAGRKF
jgi:hypothetical protein